MGVLLDTSFLIALNNMKDDNKKAAEVLKEKIRNGEFGKAYFSDYIFDEFVTFLKAKHVPLDVVNDVGEALLFDSGIQLLKVDDNIFNKAWKLFKKFGNLSFTDCTTAVLGEEFGIKNLASFDGGFDSLVFLNRI